MLNALTDRLNTATSSAERQLAAATELLDHLHQQRNALQEVITRQEAVVDYLRAAVNAGQEVQARYNSLAGLEGLDKAVGLQEQSAATVTGLATAANQEGA